MNEFFPNGRRLKVGKIEITDKKSDLIDIIRNYRKNNDGLRFGQDLWNKMAEKGYWDSPEANSLFFISDNELAEIMKDE
jgi:hypothetical protein